MNIKHYRKFANFGYQSNVSAANKFKLGDVVFKPVEFNGEDISEIGVIIQVHDEHDYRTDMFGNCDDSEITLATMEQITTYRPKLLKELEELEEPKRTFLVITERKRVKNRVSFYIGEIINGEMKLINNDLTVLVSSNHGLVNEAVNKLVQLGELPETCIENGYVTKDKPYNIIHVESTNIAYINFH